MDYFDLLHQAQMNNKNVSSQETRCYKATFSAPKKSERSRVSSVNIKKFLARKEEEEKSKVLEAKKKKEELLALRALDKKAQKRVSIMLKHTKSANKSVMEDAIDNYNTKDTLEGPKQCDEDDYGYVSQEASAFYEKLMAKYESGPVDNPKQMTREVKDLKAAKDRVKAALDREAEEQLLPRKRKRKHEDTDAQNNEENDSEGHDKSESTTNRHSEKEPEREPEKEKPKKIPKKMPPPVDFFELMKIAAKKQHEPIMIEKKVEEVERPMTKKEKMEHQREMERQNRKKNPQSQANQVSAKSSSGKQSSSRDEPSSKSQMKSKMSSEGVESSKQKGIVKSKSEVNINNQTSHINKKKEVKFNPTVEKSVLPNRNNGIKEKVNSTSDLKAKPQMNGPSKNLGSSGKVDSKVDKGNKILTPEPDVSDIDKEIALLMKKKQLLMEAKAQKTVPKPNPASQTRKEPLVQKSSQEVSSKFSSSTKPSNIPMKKPISDNRNGNPSKPNDKCRMGDSKDRDKSSLKNLNEKDRPLPKTNIDRDRMHAKKPSAMQKRFSPPRYGPPSKQAPQMKKKPPNKRVINSESEYDSEMDDFIDDGPEDCMDYSSHIKEIFGYDKSRYASIDEDECEESSYRTQMIEERRSAKIGLLEDLEDIQREKEEKARAKARQMQKMKKR